MHTERSRIELFVRSLTPGGAAPRQKAVLDERGLSDGFVALNPGDMDLPRLGMRQRERISE